MEIEWTVCQNTCICDLEVFSPLSMNYRESKVQVYYIKYAQFVMVGASVGESFQGR